VTFHVRNTLTFSYLLTHGDIRAITGVVKVYVVGDRDQHSSVYHNGGSERRQPAEHSATV